MLYFGKASPVWGYQIQSDDISEKKNQNQITSF